MRNVIYFFLGDSLDACALSLKEELQKQSTPAVESCLHVFSWERTDTDVVIRKVVFKAYDQNAFHSEITSGVYDFEIEKNIPNDDDAVLSKFLRLIIAEANGIDAVGANEDTLFNIVLPVNDSDCIEDACKIATQLGNLTRVFSDVILLNVDVMTALGVEEESNHEASIALSKSHIEKLMELKDNEGLLKRIILIQNTNANGAVLNLNADSLPIIFATLGELEVQEYGSIFPIAIDVNPGEITTLGLSSFMFDRNYAAQYLLRRAYVELMSKEGVDQVQVDANMVSNVSQNALTAYQNMFSNFYNNTIQPQLNGGTATNIILNNAGQSMSNYLDDAKNAITSFIQNPNLSLPEKRGVLSKMLMLDDVSIEGVQFNNQALTFLDYYTETMEYFIKLNNGVMFELDDEGRPKVDQNGKKVIRHDVVHSPLNEKGEEVYLPIKRIKDLRLDIHQDAQDLRRCKDKKKKLEERLENRGQADIVIAEGEETLRRNGYKLISAKIEEQPLAEDYMPEKTTTIQAVQLKSEFTPIKDQGEIGSCSAFAVVSVIEYILKKTKIGNPDLSERFVYYNVRETSGNIDEQGASLSDIIKSITDKGVCRENDCPYIGARMNDKPTPVAYEHAQECKIAQAKNIIIGNDVEANVDLLRTAVAEGYPVIFSLRLSEAFKTTKGYVETPTENELMNDNTHDRHAMVICGYDDKTECFLVRNSWGRQFGTDGYCYIPYDYVGDKKFTACAYIITALSSVDNKHVVGIKDTYKVDFNQADTIIGIAIANKNIRRLEREIEKKKQEYVEVRREFEDLKNDFCDRRVRQTIVKLSRESANRAIKDKEYNIQLLNENMRAELTNLESENTNLITIQWCLSGLTLLIYLLLGFNDISNWVDFWLILPVTSVICFFIGWHFYKKRREMYDNKKKEYDDKIAYESSQIGQLRQRLTDLEIRSYFAGEFLDKIQSIEMDLINLQQTTESYTENLKVWYNEEQNNVNRMDIRATIPNNFVSAYTNADLDNLFNENAQQWLDGQHLWNYLDGNSGVGEVGVITFKNNLKSNLLDRLRSVLQPISLSEALMGNEDNNLLNGRTAQDVLSQCSGLSVPFADIANDGNSMFIVFVQGGDQHNTTWQSMVRPAFALPPTCCSIDRDNVLTLVQVCGVTLDNIAI